MADNWRNKKENLPPWDDGFSFEDRRKGSEEESKSSWFPQWPKRKGWGYGYRLMICVLWGGISSTYTGILVTDQHMKTSTNMMQTTQVYPTWSKRDAQDSGTYGEIWQGINGQQTMGGTDGSIFKKTLKHIPWH